MRIPGKKLNLHVIPVTAAAVLLLQSCRSTSEPRTGGSRFEIVSQVGALFPALSESLLVARDSVFIAPSSVRWRSTDPARLRVDSTGVVTALALGSASVIASHGGQTDTVNIQVIEPPAGRIVFVGAAPEHATQPRLYEIRGDGLGLRPFAEWLGTPIGPPAFSPDGSMLAVPSGNSPRILILSSDGLRVLSEPTQGLGCGSSQPAWSPAGDSLAFSSCAAGAFDVWISSRDGAARRKVTSFADPVAQEVAFTPDARALVVRAFQFDSQAGSRVADLYGVDLASGEARRLTSTPREEESTPFVHFPTGRLYFSRHLPDAPGSRPRAEAVAVFGSDLELRTPEQLTPVEPRSVTGFAPSATYPKSSPDGQWLVFAFNREVNPAPGLRIGDPMIGTRPEIYVMRLRDRAMVRLTHLSIAVQPTWTQP
jgi:hypothetical protein